MDETRLRFSVTLGSNDLGTFRPTLSDRKKLGFFSQDAASQTERSDVIELNQVNTSVQALMNSLASVKRDLNFAKHALQADYEAKMDARASDLYTRLNERLSEIEKMHQEKVQVVRRSYRSQLADFVAKISGEYKAYYDDMMQGKFGRHDAKLKTVQSQNEDLNKAVQQNESVIQMLQMQLQQAHAERDELEEQEGFVMPSVEPGISIEEFEDLQMDLEKTQSRVDELQSTVIDKESAVRKLTSKVNELYDELEEERELVQRLKQDVVAEKRRAEAAAGRASDLADHQLALLQKEMKAKIEIAKKEAYEEAVREATDKHRKNVGEFEKELAHRQALEEKMRKEQETLQGDSAVSALKRLQKVEKEQKAEIARLKTDLERLNKSWQVKFAVLQRTLHAVKDESYIRKSLHQQATKLHHATVTYACDVPVRALIKARNPRTKAVLPCIEPKLAEDTFMDNRVDGAYEDGQYGDTRLYVSPASALARRSCGLSPLQRPATQGEVRHQEAIPIARCVSEGEGTQQSRPHTPSKSHVVIVPSVGVV